MIALIKKTWEGITRREISTRFRPRALEWEHGLIAVGWGFTLLVNPGLFALPSFRAFLGGPYVWGGIVMGFGVLNVIALLINGLVARPTAAIRTITAASQIFLFLVIASGLLFSGVGGTGIWTYFILGVFGFPAAAWALLDAVAPEYAHE